MEEAGQDIDQKFFNVDAIKQTWNTIVEYDPDPFVTIETEETDQKLFSTTTATELVLGDLDAYLQLDQPKEEAGDGSCPIQIRPSVSGFQSEFFNRDCEAVSIKDIDSSNLSQSISKKRPLKIEGCAGAKKFKGFFATSSFTLQAQSATEPQQCFSQRNPVVSTSSRSSFPDDVCGNILQFNAREKSSASPQVNTTARSSNSELYSGERNNSKVLFATCVGPIDVGTSIEAPGRRHATNNNVLSKGIQVAAGLTEMVQESTMRRKNSIFAGPVIKNVESPCGRKMPSSSLEKLRVNEVRSKWQSTSRGKGYPKLVSGTYIRSGDMRARVGIETKRNNLPNGMQISTRPVEPINIKEPSVDVGRHFKNAELVNDHKSRSDISTQSMRNFNLRLNKLISSPLQHNALGSPSLHSNSAEKISSRMSLDTYVKTGDLETGVEEEVEISSTVGGGIQVSVMDMVKGIRAMIGRGVEKTPSECILLLNDELTNVDVRSATVDTLMILLKLEIKKQRSKLMYTHRKRCPYRICRCSSIELLDFFKKNAWTDRLKELVLAIVGKLALLLPLRSIGNRDSALEVFLNEEVIPLWPNDWITGPQIVHQCREIFKMSKLQLYQNFGIISRMPQCRRSRPKLQMEDDAIGKLIKRTVKR